MNYKTIRDGLYDKIGESSTRGLVSVAFTFVGFTMMPIIGCAAGEILDNIPYLNHAIPEGFSIMGNVVTGSDTVANSRSYLEGNLDKVGGALGFVWGGVKTYVIGR